MSFENKKFGILTILKAVDANHNWVPYSRFADYFWCRCKCGNELVLWRSVLASRVRLDCGFCRRLVHRKSGHGTPYWSVRPASRHGHMRNLLREDGTIRRFTSAEWNSWQTMLQRCNNKKHHAYENYGGRGIRVCARWQEPRTQGFINFIADMGPRPWGKTLDRVNPQGHYEPTNCQWATPKEQGQHQRRFIWRDTTPPPVEKVRKMEHRVKEYATGFEEEF